MPAINQRIPNFLGGVSQQPDTIKFPGQLRVCDNAVPDVTFGLKKRPPGEFVKELSYANSTGYWYEILRDGDEKYIMQITSHADWKASTSYAVGDTVHNDNGKVYVCDQAGTSAGSGGPTGIQGDITDGGARWDYEADLSKWIRIWDLADGTEKYLTNSPGDSVYSYLAGATNKYAIQSIQDYTIIANPQKTIGTTGTTDTPINSGNYAFARLDTVAYNTEYILYDGSSPVPATNTYWRVTAVRVDVIIGSSSLEGETWDSTDIDGRDAGNKSWSFDNSTSSHNDTNCYNVTGHLTVNASNYVDSNQANYQADDASGTPGTSGTGADFIGYTQIYKTRYIANATLKDGGLIKELVKSDALAKWTEVEIEGVNYRISVESVEPVQTYEGVANIAFYRSPKNPDEGRLSMAKILEQLKSTVNSDLPSVTAEIIGNGLYLYSADDKAPKTNFLGGAVNEMMSIFGNTAQDVSRLPNQCKHDYVVQIANADNTDSDNYYVKFIADNGTSGSGKWEECVRPHNFSSGSDPMVKGLDPASMPHAIVNNRTTPTTFTFKKLDETTANADNNDNYWKYREVGDDETNRFPSFKGLKIQKIFFHRNRLGFVANEQVVMSRPGDYFNFFIVSALTTSDDNPVDITVSDIKPAYIHHVLPINKGIMMFSDNGQFLLFTESDIFSSKTARLKKISSYETDASLEPVDMGTSVMFTSAVSAYARAYEASILDDDVPPKILEQTRVVPEYLPKTIDISCNSTAIGINTFAKSGGNEVYHYKFFDSGDRRDQSAWYSWTLTGTLIHCFYTAGSFYTVTLLGSAYVLNRYEYVADATAARTYTLGTGTVGSPITTSRWFEVCLDCMTIPTNNAYHTPAGGTPYTALTIPYSPTGTSNFYAVAIAGSDTSGNPVAGQVVKATSVGTNEARFENTNMQGWTVAVGYSYLTTIELPNYYLAIEPTKYDIDGDLRISGINFEMGVSGPMEFHITSQYADMDDFIQYESGMKLDDSDFGKPPSQLMKSVRVPIQKKNEKYNLTIKIPDPFSTALISASWDGNYNQRRHVRR